MSLFWVPSVLCGTVDNIFGIVSRGRRTDRHARRHHFSQIVKVQSFGVNYYYPLIYLFSIPSFPCAIPALSPPQPRPTAEKQEEGENTIDDWLSLLFCLHFVCICVAFLDIFFLFHISTRRRTTTPEEMYILFFLAPTSPNTRMQHQQGLCVMVAKRDRWADWRRIHNNSLLA